MELQITTLIENEPDDNGKLLYEHGLSLYIEFQGKKLLFDTGQTGAFLSNAQKLGKSVDEVDYILISHGHYDHSGGVPALLQYLREQKTMKEQKLVKHKGISMLVGEEFFHPKYKKMPEGNFYYNGNPFNENDLLNENISLKKITEDITYLTDKILIFKNFTRYHDYEQTNPKFFVKERAENREQYEQDIFVDEIAIGLLTGKGLVLIAGCSHVGIVNIIDNVIRKTKLPVYAVLGGTHLIEAGEERLQQTVQAFRNFGIQQIAVSHCTGEAGVTLVKKEYKESFIRNNTGNVYSL